MKAAREMPGIKRILVASGVRMDLALSSPEYLRELAEHHVGGLLKVAPEHTDPQVLDRMKKPPIDCFLNFDRAFCHASAQAKKRQYLVPYFIAGHPGCDLTTMVELAVFLKQTGYRPDKVQDYIPLPMDLATCMYYTGMDPMTGEEVYVPRTAHERRLQRALLQYFKPENYFDVREALTEAGRTDLIGNEPDSLIGPYPPKLARNAQSGSTTRSSESAGYRPHRKTGRRRQRGDK